MALPNRLARFRTTIHPGLLLAAAGVLAFSLSGNAAPANHPAKAPRPSARVPHPLKLKSLGGVPAPEYHMPNRWTAGKLGQGSSMPNRWNGVDPKAMDDMNRAPKPLDLQAPPSAGFGAGNSGSIFGK